MRIRTAIATCATTLVWLALMAAPALAKEGGAGTYGKADDKVVTNFGFGILIGFALLVTVLSTIQHLLDRRKSR